MSEISCPICKRMQINKNSLKRVITKKQTNDNTTLTVTVSLVSTSQQRPPLYNGHFLLSTRWPLYGDSTVFSLKSIMHKCIISEAFSLNFLVRKSRRFIRGTEFNQENTVFQQQVKLLFYISKTEGRNETNMQSPKFCTVL